MNLIAVIVSSVVRLIAYLNLFFIFRRALCLMFLAITVSSCSDSRDTVRGATDDGESPRGIWEEHACRVAIPEGLMETDFTCGTFTVPADWGLKNPAGLAARVGMVHISTILAITILY